MTPEERATEVLFLISNPSSLEVLSNTIKVAENEALERAAMELLEGAIHYGRAYDEAAEIVRGLKHKDI